MVEHLLLFMLKRPVQVIQAGLQNNKGGILSTQYPNAIDTLVNPGSNDFQDSITIPHNVQHTNANDAIEAIEGALGINPHGTFATVRQRLDVMQNAISGIMYTSISRP